MSNDFIYPRWEEDKVTLKLSDNHFFTVELRENACNLTVTELTHNRDNLLTFRIYVDEAMMEPEHFRMVVEHFLRDSTKKGILHERWTALNIVDDIVNSKTELEQLKMKRNSKGDLHCGSVFNHSRHYHMEGPFSYECVGWNV